MRWLVALLLTGCVVQVQSPTSYADNYVEIEQNLIAEADQLGVKLIRTDMNRSIAFRKRVYLSRKMDKDAAARVNVLTHEIEHARQYRRERAFLLRYVFSPRFRYRVEREAVEQEIRVLKAVGAPEKDIIRTLRRFEESLGEMYLLHPRRKGR